MGKRHLADLRQALEKHHWVVKKECEGNGYDISSVWIITRPDGTCLSHVEFEGLDDMEVLPVEKSYACRLREDHSISAYFSRIGRSWPSELEKFICALDDWGT